jgi:hypothetical protein
MLLLALLGCAAQQNLQEDLTAPLVVPTGASYDSRLPTDPANSGVAIRPSVAHVKGAATLVVQNESGGSIRCEVWQDALCPVEALALEGLEELPDGTRWELPVGCFLGDLACLPLEGDDATPSLRAWTWFVEPDADATRTAE